ncbi:tRNA 2-thiouridine(34) synthase MnmA [Marinilabilia rubra]|uniref:tRNA-specific 2-thiouridylase MnmA n=1 Tax=Marinilabilia rubra TaxID=2162893 RepID=A0A2U2B4Y0_9BACT|nr:tRNA 2-thiouridine(34) synthase MnmA [Marinilabilia rubra]PWD98128.1 tRNA 2-thiouridine(34) synthase MnmA [Marinilabilia rubra]
MVDQKPENKRVLLGMSGGLDSTMSALLLHKQGYEVHGVTLKTWHVNSEKQEKDLIKAEQLAHKLGIDHSIFDISSTFKKNVVDYFCDEYLRGRTPNPCNRCNPMIKWPRLMEMADAFDCRYIATGHYVQKVKTNNKWYIKKGVDPSKDQSYFLWNLNQDILNRAIFPLGKLTKEEVRELALSNGLENVADQKESMGVCFLDNLNYRDFLQKKHDDREIDIQEGEIVNESGKVIGKHQGIPFFTIGQKRGLNLEDKSYRVIDLDSENNRVVVSKTANLETSQLTLKSFYLSESLYENEAEEVHIRIRGLDKVPPIPGRITHIEGGLNVIFDVPAWAITPGQSIVFYQNDLVIGGGIY